jgi:hypothetical protein
MAFLNQASFTHIEEFLEVQNRPSTYYNRFRSNEVNSYLLNRLDNCYLHTDFVKECLQK